MKYLSKRPFSSRPSTPEFRRNWEETFGHKTPEISPNEVAGDAGDVPKGSDVLPIQDQNAKNGGG